MADGPSQNKDLLLHNKSIVSICLILFIKKIEMTCVWSFLVSSLKSSNDNVLLAFFIFIFNSIDCIKLWLFTVSDSKIKTWAFDI